MSGIVFTSKRRQFLLLLTILIILLCFFLYSGYKSAEIPVSYLPEINTFVIDSSLSDSNPVKLKFSSYELLVDHNGRISVKTSDGESIISALTYYAEFNENKSGWGLKNVLVSLINDTCIVLSGNGSDNTQIKLILTSSRLFPKINVTVETYYGSQTTVRREALVALFDNPVSEVYLKNRKIAKKNFEPEYWLQKEGVRFGRNETSALIYHTPLVSSLQLLTKKNILFINLDFSLDHPFVHFPYQSDETGKWIDLSKSEYKKGTGHRNSFSINFGPLPVAVPRLMLVPNGYRAAYIFTEHADGGDIQKQRAAYFGSEDIKVANEATGGFVGHKIPVTKSVFYTGPATLPGASIYEDGKISPLLNFLDELHATNLYKLCLHTPDDLSSTREILETSMKFMKERYNTSTWIDHGFYSGKINREAMVCDGLDSTSQFYAADLWKKYDTKYFWSPAVEILDNANWVSATDELKKMKFYKAYVSFLQHYLTQKDLRQLNIIQIVKELKKRYSHRRELNTLEYYSRNSKPTPLYWQHPTRTQQFYSWATNFEKYFGEATVANEKEQLLNLIDNQGVFINHGYFPRNRDKRDGIITTDRNGKLVIDPKFDSILTIMSQMRDREDLYITTVKVLMDYWIALEKISFEYLPDGTINILNNNDYPIKGLSLKIEAKTLLINGKVPSMKHSGGGTIFWFDIDSHQTLRLQVG
jgi:hypothetical protein